MDALKLENQICFPLYAASRQITTLYKPLLGKMALTYPQYLVMMIMWEYERRTVKQLGDLLLLDSGTLTPLLKRMEEKGLLSRSRSVDDERVVNISLTNAGRKLKAKALAIPRQLACNIGMEEKDLQALQFLLLKMMNTLNQD